MSMSLLVLLWTSAAIACLAKGALNGHALTFGDVVIVVILWPFSLLLIASRSMHKLWDRELWSPK